jgi:diguanylate cyclase (GGDEF)-like protein
VHEIVNQDERLLDFVSMSDRDRAAEERDREAEGRDLAAQGRDDIAGATGERSIVRALAAMDRHIGARDRAAAAADRESARRDLASAGLDDLTGAMGRRAGLAAIQREMDRAERSGEELVLAFVDTVGLKEINDTKGHAAGDRVLEAIATTMKEDLRCHDFLVRVGGDEFVCTHSGQDAAQLDARYEALSGLLAAAASDARMTVGLAALRSGDSLGELIDRADRAMLAVRRSS